MTDEEIEKEAKEYAQGNYYSEQGFLYGYERGFAEGRKEKCCEQNKDGTIRPCEVMKDNEQLKQQIEQLSNDNHVLKTAFITQQEQIERLEEDKEQIIFESDLKIKALEEMNEELEKENAELEKDKEWLDNTDNEQTEVILKLQEQIEKMKCCGNCKKQYSCIKHNNFIYPEMTNPINYGCNNLSKWELEE